MRPYFSVIVPARNEAQYLSKALAALHAQDWPRHDFEIIVVDNHSEDATAEIARANGADRIIMEPIHGTNFAREAGRRAARGQIIACLDADCEPPRDWLRRIARALSQKGVAAISGPYDYGFQGITRIADNLFAHWFFACVGPISTFFRKPFGVVRAGNFAAWNRALDAIGGFPPYPFWGDDTALGLMIARRVGRVRYLRRFVVKSSPRRFVRSGIFRTTFQYLYHFFRVYFARSTP